MEAILPKHFNLVVRNWESSRNSEVAVRGGTWFLTAGLQVSTLKEHKYLIA